MIPVGLDHLTLFGMPPLQFVEIAAAAGAQTVGLQPGGFAEPPGGHEPYGLVGNPALCRELRRRMDDLGLAVGMIDGLLVAPGRSVRDYEASLADLAHLGVTRANAVSFDALDRTVDEFALLAELARPYGIRILLETCPLLTVRTLAQALGIIAQLDANLGLVIDTLHVARTGEAELLARIDPALIGYVQLSDAPAAYPESDAAYMDMALHERQLPGEGELPLAAMLRAIPPGVVISAEVPLRSREAQGWTAQRRAAAVVEASRRYLAGLGRT